MDPKEVYGVVYETVRREAAKEDCPAPKAHRKFAMKLPEPDSIGEREALILSSMVSACPGDWGLEGFFQVVLDSGEMLGDLVRSNIQDVSQYYSQQEDVARKYL